MRSSRRRQAKRINSHWLHESGDNYLDAHRPGRGTQGRTAGSPSTTARALDYSLKRWAALTRYLDDGQVPIGRVEMWRGGRRFRLSVSTPFVRWCPSSVALAPFPHPAHRTGRADFPHPALFQHIKPSRSHGRYASAAGGSIPRFHRGTGRSIGGTPFPACRVFASTRSAHDAPHSDRSGGRFDLPAPG